MTEARPLITILGPTACGKTRLGVALAKHFDGEIISADSRQVYRGMDIGTGKDLQDYGQIPYHLIDIVDPDEDFSLFHYAREFCRAYQEICRRHRQPVLVGGSGLYLDAVINRYPMHESVPDPDLRHELEQLNEKALQQRLLQLKPQQHNTTDLEDRTRCIRAIEVALAEQRGTATIEWPHTHSLLIGIKAPRDLVRQRITQRLKQRLEEGMIDEVAALHAQGTSWEKLEFFGLEYRYLARYLQGQLNYNDMFQKLNSAIHLFAKKQQTWFRNIEKKGRQIHWLELDENLESGAIAHLTEALDK